MSAAPVQLRRLAWFAALWLAGIAVVGTVAYGLRAVIFAAVGTG